MQSKNKRSAAWTGYAGLLVGAGLIMYLFSKVDIAGSVSHIRSIGIVSVLILVPYLLLHLSETFAWKKLIPGEVGRISFYRLLKIQLVSETVSMTLPAGVAVGEPLRPWLCRRFLLVPLPDGIASVAVRKLLLGVTQGFYTILGAIAGFSMLQEVSQQVIGFNGLGIIMMLAGSIMTFVFLAMLLLMTNGKAVKKLHRVLMKVPFDGFREWLLRMEEGFVETDRKLQRVIAGGVHTLLPVILAYVAAWMMLALESYLILKLLGVDVTFTQVMAFDTALTMLRVIFFFIPSGLGIQDLGYLAFFLALGIPDHLAYGGAFVMLRRLKEVIWYSTGYGVMFMEGIHLQDAQKVSEEGA
jgi:uncharacterized protein (TIRG00374 family)